MIRLIIEDSSENDAGEYTSVFTNSAGTEVVQRFTAEYRATVTINTDDGIVYRHFSNASATLDCDAMNYDIIQWQYANSSVVETAPDGRIRLEGTNLFFTKLSLDDSGMYQCVAGTTDVGHETISAHLLVYGEWVVF